MFTPIRYGEQCFLMKLMPPHSDGMGGFSSEKWVQTTEFIALIDRNSSTTALIAEKQGITSVYTIYIDASFEIHKLDIFKRGKDSQCFRVTSDPDDQITPKTSNMNFKVFTAEQYRMPQPN